MSVSATEAFGILSGAIMVLGGPPYLFDILKGKTKPQRTTWFIWTVLGMIAFASQIKLGGHWSLVYMGLNALGNLAVFLLSLKFGTGGWKRLDIITLIIAVGGVIVSIMVDSPLTALWGTIIAGAAGDVLTVYKAYLEPSTETAVTWFFLGTSSLFAALAVGRWSYPLLLYPIYLCITTYDVLIAQWLGWWLHPRTPHAVRVRAR